MLDINDDDLQDAWEFYDLLCKRFDEEKPNPTCTFVAAVGFIRHITRFCGIGVDEAVDHFREAFKEWVNNEQEDDQGNRE